MHDTPRAQAGKPMLRIEAIDALRGLAALYVIAFHVLDIPSILVVPHAFFKAGGTGVTLFFVISAFTLCLSAQNRKEEPRPLLRFYLRRIFRITPLFFVLLFIEIAILRIRFHSWPTLSALASNLTFTYNFIPGQQEGIIWASWTIGVEMAFYAFFPQIFHVVRSFGRAVVFFCATIFISMVVGAAVHYRTDFYSFSIFRHLPAFACDFVLFFFVRDFGERLGRVSSYFFILASCAGHCFLFSRGIHDYGQAVAMQSVVWALLVIGLCISPLSLFVNSFTRFAGSISYSMYLIHPMLLFSLSTAFVFLQPLGGAGQFMASLAIATTIVVTIAFASYRLIEQPGIRLGSRLIKKYCVSSLARVAPEPF